MAEKSADSNFAPNIPIISIDILDVAWRAD
jgi:hypothetical protein